MKRMKEMVEFIIGILTVLVAYFLGIFLAVELNWPDAPTVVAIAFMGSEILWNIRHKRGDDQK
jgi:hypothetical protein